MHFDVHFWEGLCFALLAVLSYRPIKKAISNHLAEYANAIEKQINEAEELHQEAKKTFQHYTEQHKIFSKKIETVTKNTEETIQDLKQRTTKQLEEKIKTKQEIQQDRLNLYRAEHTKRIKLTIVNKAMILVTCYLEDTSTPNLTKGQITELLNTTKDKSITFH